MKLSILFPALILLMDCSGGQVKHAINQTGEKAGEAVGEAVKGVKTGVENAYQIKIELADSLVKKGIRLGKVTLSDEKQSNDNMLSVYIIFDKDFEQDVMLRVTDRQGLESGRCKVSLKGRKDEARYIDFHFDKRTNIDRDDKLILE